MSWDLYIDRASKSGSVVDSGPPLGKLIDVRKSLDKYFPGGTWNGRGSVDCNTAHGSIRFDLAGNPVEYVSVEAHPTSGSLGLILLAMARENGWRVIDDGSGDLLDLEYPRSAKAIQKIQQEATDRQTNPGKVQTTSKPRLGSVKMKVPLHEAHEAEYYDPISLCLLGADESSDDVFCQILPFVLSVLSRANNEKDLDSVGQCGNEEILLPNGGRLSMIQLDSDEMPHAERLMQEFYDTTGRIPAKISRGFVKLQGGLKFRVKECYFVRRALSRR